MLKSSCVIERRCGAAHFACIQPPFRWLHLICQSNDAIRTGALPLHQPVVKASFSRRHLTNDRSQSCNSRTIHCFDLNQIDCLQNKRPQPKSKHTKTALLEPIITYRWLTGGGWLNTSLCIRISFFLCVGVCACVCVCVYVAWCQL